VRMRARNPWVRARLRFFGWYVRFIGRPAAVYGWPPARIAASHVRDRIFSAAFAQRPVTRHKADAMVAHRPGSRPSVERAGRIWGAIERGLSGCHTPQTERETSGRRRPPRTSARSGKAFENSCGSRFPTRRTRCGWSPCVLRRRETTRSS
jgi:hypothetical protein